MPDEGSSHSTGSLTIDLTVYKIKAGYMQDSLVKSAETTPWSKSTLLPGSTVPIDFRIILCYTACLLLTTQLQLLCQVIVGLLCKWLGLLRLIWGVKPPPPLDPPLASLTAIRSNE
jgi:hypothetical protein